MFIYLFIFYHTSSVVCPSGVVLEGIAIETCTSCTHDEQPRLRMGCHDEALARVIMQTPLFSGHVCTLFNCLVLLGGWRLREKAYLRIQTMNNVLLKSIIGVGLYKEYFLYVSLVKIKKHCCVKTIAVCSPNISKKMLHSCNQYYNSVPKAVEILLFMSFY